MKLSTRDIILVGLFAALMAVGAYLKIPTPFVPVTFQLFFAIYAGVLLGAFKGGLAMIIYTLIGLTGVPVFSKGGGPAYIFESSFGFILGFILCAFVVGYLTERMKSVNPFKLMGICLIGFVMIYVVGDLYMYMILNVVAGKPTSLMTINGWMTLFMVKDLILTVIVAITTTMILPILRKAGYTKVTITE